MEYFREELFPCVSLTAVQTDKFKTGCMTAYLLTQLHRETAAENAVKEFGKADIAIIGGDNVSDYPEWDKSCALPKKNFSDLKYKLNAVAENTTKSGKVLYVAGNNDFILGDIGTAENEPYNTTDFCDYMEKSLGKLPENEKSEVKSIHKPKEK